MFTALMTRQIDEFTKSFVALKVALASGITVQTSFISLRIDKTVESISEHFNSLFAAAHWFWSVNTHNLMKLNPTEMDDPLHSKCLPNICLDIIGDIYDHSAEARSDPVLLIQMVTYQLGEFDPHICTEIARILEEIPHQASTFTLAISNTTHWSTCIITQLLAWVGEVLDNAMRLLDLVFEKGGDTSNIQEDGKRNRCHLIQYALIWSWHRMYMIAPPPDHIHNLRRPLEPPFLVTH